MKFLFLTLFLGVLVICASAVVPQKSILVTYPNDTPYSVINDAKRVFEEAGGVITHEYKLIKGFAAKASGKALETLSTLASEYQPYIEEDQMVAVDGDLVEGGHL